MPPAIHHSWRNCVLFPLLVFLPTLGVFAFFDLDKTLAGWLAAQPGGFPFAHSAAYDYWLHFFPKCFIAGPLFVGILMLALLVTPFISLLEKIPNQTWRKLLDRYSRLTPVVYIQRCLAALPRGSAAALWLSVIAIVFSMEMIGHLKRAANVYCPILVAAYGGSVEVPVEAIAEPFPSFGPNGGNCWPGGHAITGFIFVACFFGFSSLGMKRCAWGSLAFALVFGNLLGVAQVIRGQHYLSHQLWSAYLCWNFSLLVFWCAEQLSFWRQYRTRKSLAAEAGT